MGGGRVEDGQNAITAADQHSRLNGGQKAVIEDVLSSRDRIQGIQGVAGAGKTTTLEVIRTAAEANGYQVEGFAPTSRAAKQLEQAGIGGGRRTASCECGCASWPKNGAGSATAGCRCCWCAKGGW